MILDAAQQHPRDLMGASKLQMLGQFLFGAEAGGAVGTVRQDTKATGIAGELIGGKPAVSLLRDEAYHKDYECGNSKAERRKYHEQIFERVEHPDALDHFTGGVEHRLLSKLQGVKQHSIEIPSGKCQHSVERNAGPVAFIPTPPFICDAILQFFQQF